MKKFFKIAGYVLGGIVLLIIAGFVYFNSKYPDVGKPKDIKVEISPERIKRGEYLANHVAGCMDCHAVRDWSKFSGPPKPGTLGIGGDKFGREMGFPGDIYAKNITPAAIGSWTDGELVRAITQGVNKDDKALFPLMPYLGFNHLTQEDLYAIVAYIRSLQPQENKIPDTELDFPLSLIVKTIPPGSYTPAAEPNRNDPAAYGKYLVTIADCAGCHTPSVKGDPKPGMDYAGGEEFNFPQGVLRPANITPDKETGIGKWTKDEFIARFKAFDSDSARNMRVDPNGFNTIMPWTLFAGMTNDDLGAIYDYLQSVKPVHNSVIHFTPAKLRE
jgi:mono/diheme cytochrome c family protein